MDAPRPTEVTLQGVEGIHAQKPRLNRRHLAMGPGLIVLFGLAIFPAIYSLVISFQNWNLTNPDSGKFVGFKNYIGLLTDGDFWHSVWITVVFVAVAVVLETVLGFLLALAFFRPLPGHQVFRTLLLLPMLAAPIVVGLLARFMLDPQFGIINYMLGLVGLGPQELLSNPDTALMTLTLIDVWQWTPFMFLIFLAAMQSLPDDIIEAGKLDGASRRQLVWHMFLPLMIYPILVAVTLRVIDAFRVYDIIYATTRGGPIDATATMSWRIYEVGFKVFNISYASAYSWLMLIIVVVVAGRLLRQTTKKDVEES